MIFPNEIVAGETIEADLSYIDFPSSEYSLKIAVVGSVSKAVISANSLTNNNFHIIFDTKDLAEGLYAYQVQIVKNSTIVKFVESGNLKIKPNLFNQTTFDSRIHAQKMIEAIEALIENRATNEHKSLKVNNRELVHHSFDELKKLRNEYRTEMSVKNFRKRKAFNHIGIRF